jgi:hypothetical protein
MMEFTLVVQGRCAGSGITRVGPTCATQATSSDQTQPQQKKCACQKDTAANSRGCKTPGPTIPAASVGLDGPTGCSDWQNTTQNKADGLPLLKKLRRFGWGPPTDAEGCTHKHLAPRRDAATRRQGEDAAIKGPPAPH